MKARTIVLRLLTVLWAASVACPAFADHFAVATGGSSIYIIREGSTWPGLGSVVSVYSAGSSLAGIAMSGNWVFAADKAENQLVIGRMENVLAAPVLSNVRTISLTSLSKPSSVAIDDEGGVYVIGSERVFDPGSGTMVSRYAYVTAAGGDWAGNIEVNYGVNMDSVLADVAALPGGKAIIANDKTVGTTPRVSHATKVEGTANLQTRVVGQNPDNPPSSQPSAVAVLNKPGQSALAYVLSRVGLLEEGIYGTLDVIDTNGLNTLGTYRLDRNFNPEDAAITTLGGIDYLTIIGRPRRQADNSAQAWRIPLTAGMPDFSSLATFKWSGENAGGQNCDMSADGEVFWSTHPGSAGPTVSALGAADWTSEIWDLSATQGLGIGDICAYNYVPEPSAVAFLLSGVATAALLLKRRLS